MINPSSNLIAHVYDLCAKALQQQEREQRHRVLQHRNLLIQRWQPPSGKIAI
jgi:hypothetical protein